jgi:DNA polymerase I-like protein with 3'-5' exonuclease and polymerase domains
VNLEQLDLPSLVGVGRITLDLETHDPDLIKKGPGVRRDGYIVGVGISVNGNRQYIPVAHRTGPNADREKVFGWLKKELGQFQGEILGANLLYDLDYLGHIDIAAPFARIRDIQIAEPLIDETRQEYSLEALAQSYLGEGKREDQIATIYGPKWKSKMRDIDARILETYVIGDLELPERIYEKQLERLASEDLLPLFDMESDLIPMMLYMRREGVAVDLKRAEQASNEFYLKTLEVRKKIRHLVGFDVNVNAGDSIAKAFDSLGIPYGKTSLGKASFTKSFLNACPHEIAALIREERNYSKTKGTFIDGYILDGHINGRIHAQFNQLRGDETGTVSGRFSSSGPNLQNIPARDEIMGPLMRGMFVPDQGCSWWARDWSQIEFRILVHYAAVCDKRGADEAVRLYQEDPKADFHVMVANMTGLGRKDAKNVNFGIVYGMGKAKMARDLNRSVEEAEAILAQHEERVPFAKSLSKDATRAASQRGYIKTLLGRRRRFNEWEENVWRSDEEKKKIMKDEGKGPTWFFPVKDRELALEKWGHRIKRAYTHAALNAVIQGTAADLMKKAMVDIWKAGICKELKVQLTVHDELDGSVPDTPAGREALKELHHIMEHVVPLRVPIKAEGGEGANWNEAK